MCSPPGCNIVCFISAHLFILDNRQNKENADRHQSFRARTHFSFHFSKIYKIASQEISDFLPGWGRKVRLLSSSNFILIHSFSLSSFISLFSVSTHSCCSCCSCYSCKIVFFSTLRSPHQVKAFYFIVFFLRSIELALVPPFSGVNRLTIRCKFWC